MGTSAANEQLSAYLDGELSEFEIAEFERRLDAEPELRAELVELEGAVHFLRRHGPSSAPVGLFDDIMSAVEQEPVPRDWWSWVRRPFGVRLEGWAVAAAAAVVLMIAIRVPLGGNGATNDLTKEAPGMLQAAPAALEVAATVRPSSEASPEEEKAAPGLDKQKQRPVASRSKNPKGSADPLALQTTESSAGSSTSSDPGGQWSATPKPSKAAERPADAAEQTSSKPGFYGVGSRYTVSTDDPDVLLYLQRLAGKRGGRVLDMNGRPIAGMDGETASGSFQVELPAAMLTQFGDDLRGLGQVSTQSDSKLYTSETIVVQVDIQVEPGRSKKAGPPPSY